MTLVRVVCTMEVSYANLKKNTCSHCSVSIAPWMLSLVCEGEAFNTGLLRPQGIEEIEIAEVK